MSIEAIAQRAEKRTADIRAHLAKQIVAQLPPDVTLAVEGDRLVARGHNLAVRALHDARLRNWDLLL